MSWACPHSGSTLNWPRFRLCGRETFSAIILYLDYTTLEERFSYRGGSLRGNGGMGGARHVGATVH